MIRTLVFSTVVAAALLLAGCANPIVGSVAATTHPAARSTTAAGPATTSPSPAATTTGPSGSVNTVFTDDFTRPDNPDIGNGWIEKSPSVFSLQNNSVVKVQSSDYRDAVVYRPSSEALLDVEAQDVFTDTASGAYPGYPQAWVRIQSSTVGTANTIDGYVLYIPNSSTVAEIARNRGTSDVQTLQSINLTQALQPNGQYRLMIQAVGASPVQLSAEVDWYNGSSWQSIGSGTYSDSSSSSITTAGVCGFGGDTEVGGFAYTNFSYGTPAGSPPPPPPPATYFTDNFNRPDSANVGNNWIEKNPSVFSLQNGTVVKAASSDYRANIVYRPSSQDMRDVQASVEFVDTSTDSNSPGYPQIWTRVQENTVSTVNTLDGYILYIYDSPTTAYLGRQHGTSYVTWLQQITLSQPIQPGGRYRLTLIAQGTNPVQLTGNIAAYNGESWQTIGFANVSDNASNQIDTAGTVGFGGSVNGGLYAYDNFAFGPVGGSSPPPPNQPPTAGFTDSCSGLACTFNNTSSDSDGTIASSSWNFGDGVTSTATNPSHTYGSSGTYTVTLTVTDNSGAQDSTSQQVTVTSPSNQPPTAGFTDSCSGLACTFNNTSSDSDGTIASSSWNFGDGVTSTATNPSHTYGSSGTYTVTLTVTDNSGAQDSTSQQVTVTNPNNKPPVAKFSASCSGLTCSFTDESTDSDGRIVAWNWNFGDGTSSTQQNPTHTFAAPGRYYVTLTVTDNDGATDSVDPPATVVGLPIQTPSLGIGGNEVILLGSSYSLHLNLQDATADGPWSYTVHWGDGTTSTGTTDHVGVTSVAHSYPTGLLGSYQVSATVSDCVGVSTSATKTVTVVANLLGSGGLGGL